MENEKLFMEQYPVYLDEGKSSGWLKIPGITEEIQEALYKLTEKGVIIIGKNAEDYLNSLNNGFYYSIYFLSYDSCEEFQKIIISVAKIKTLKLI